MPVTVADLEVLLSLDDSDFQKNVKKATKGIESFKNLTKGLGESLTRNMTVPLTLAGVGVVAFGRKAFQSAAQVDTMQRGLTALMGSAEDARKEMAKLKEVAKLPGIDFRAALAGSQRLQAVGLSADRARKLMEGLANANARAGLSAENLDGALMQLSQTLSSGRLQGDELRIISERIPEFRKVLKEQFGTANSEIIGDAMKSGKLTMEAFIDGMTEGLAKLPKAEAGIQTTLKNLQNEVFLTMADAGKDLIPIVESILPDLQRMIRDLIPVAKAAIGTFKDFVPTMRLMAEVVTALAQKFAALPAWLKTTLFSATAFTAALGPLLRGVSGLVGAVQGVLATRVAMQAWWATQTSGALGLRGSLTMTQGSVQTLAISMGALLAVSALVLKTLIDINNEKARKSDVEGRKQDLRRSDLDFFSRAVQEDLKKGAESALKEFEWDAKGLSTVANKFALKDYREILAAELKLTLAGKLREGTAAVEKEMAHLQKVLNPDTFSIYREALESEVAKIGKVIDENGKIIGFMRGLGTGEPDGGTAKAKAEDPTRGIRERIADLRKDIELFGKETQEALAKFDIGKLGEFFTMPQSLKDDLLKYARDLDALAKGVEDKRIAEAKANEEAEQRNRVSQQLAESLLKEKERVESLNESIREHQKAIAMDAAQQIQSLRETIALNAAATDSERNRIDVSQKFFKDVLRGVKPEWAAMIASLQRKVFLDEESARTTATVADAIARYKDQIRQAALEVSGLSQEELARLHVLNDQNLSNATAAQMKDLMDFFKANQQFIKFREFAKETAQGIAQSFRDAFDDIREHGTLSFKTLFESIEQMAWESGARILQQRFQASLESWIGSLIGGAMGRPDVASPGPGGQLNTGFTVHRAHGGPVVDGGAYLVGERGPEMFYPNRGGTIVPNGALAGGITVNVIVPGVQDAVGFRRSTPQIAGEVARQLDAARKRGF